MRDVIDSRTDSPKQERNGSVRQPDAAPKDAFPTGAAVPGRKAVAGEFPPIAARSEVGTQSVLGVRPQVQAEIRAPLRSPAPESKGIPVAIRGPVPAVGDVTPPNNAGDAVLTSQIRLAGTTEVAPSAARPQFAEPNAQFALPAAGTAQHADPPPAPAKALSASPMQPGSEARHRAGLHALNPEMEFMLGTAERMPASGPPAPASLVMPVAEMPRPAVTQIIEAVRQNAPGTFEISLVPEALGRVRLTVTPAEAGLSIVLFAERMETLDLMRRSVEFLQQAARDHGFGDVRFTFAGSGNEGRGEWRSSGQPGEQRPMTEASSDTFIQAPTRSNADGLDLRL